MVGRRKISWAPAALADLKEAFDYIELDHPERARAWVKQILAHIEKLARFPKLGRMIPEIGQARYRELVSGEYRIFHEITDKELRIFRLLHSRRLFQTQSPFGSVRQFQKFQEWALQPKKGDLRFESLEEGVRHFKKRLKKG